jgi:hypothetical protein
MKIEKKLFALSVFAFIIGLTIILPPYLVLGIGAITRTVPICDTYVYAVTVFPNVTTLQTEYGNAAIIDIDAAYTIHSMTNIKDIDAKIDVYNYHIYSDQNSIANITHTIAITKDVLDPNSPSGFTSAIIDRSREKNSYTFIDGTIFDITEAIGYVENSRLSGIIYDQGPTNDLCPMHDVILLSSSNGERSTQALYNIRNAQKIYIDITITLMVTYKHPNNHSASSIITTTSSNSDILFHAELTKMDDGNFRYITGKVNTTDTLSFHTPDTSSLPRNDSDLPSNIIKLPPSTIIMEPAITLLPKVFAMNPVFQKQITSDGAVDDY